MTYGRPAGADVRAVGDVVDDGQWPALHARGGGEPRAGDAGLAGRHNVTNALAAAGVGVALGCRWTRSRAALGSAAGGRPLRLARSAAASAILDDTYNANPVSVRAALETVAARRRAAAGVVVCSAICSSSAHQREAHREVGPLVAALPADELVGRRTRDAPGGRDGARGRADRARTTSTTFEDTVAHLLKAWPPATSCW